MILSESITRAKNAFLYKVLLKFPYSKVRVWACRMLGHKCGENVYFPSDVVISQVFVRSCGCLTLGDRVSIGPRVTFILDSAPNFSHIRSLLTPKSPEIVVEDDAWIGANSVILCGVCVGRGSVIGAGSVVTKDVEPYTVVAGNPAKVIKRLPTGANGNALNN